MLLVLYAQSLSYDPASLVRQLTVQLSERVAFQAMDLKIWLASLIVPVPLLDGPAEVLFGEETTKLFGLWREGTYTQYGSTVIYGDALKSSNSPLQQYVWLVDKYIWGEFGAYLASTVSILNRGVWAGAGLIGLAGLFHVRAMLYEVKSDGRISALMIVALPIAILFLMQALVTANHPFFNPGLTFLYCYAIAYVSTPLPMQRLRSCSACTRRHAGSV